MAATDEWNAKIPISSTAATTAKASEHASPSSTAIPNSRHRLPWVAAQASPMVSLRPTAAAEVTWAIIPDTKSSPTDCSSRPTSSDPNVATRLATCPPVKPWPLGSKRRAPVEPLTSATTTGSTMATAETSTAAPTVAFGL